MTERRRRAGDLDESTERLLQNDDDSNHGHSHSHGHGHSHANPVSLREPSHRRHDPLGALPPASPGHPTIEGVVWFGLALLIYRFTNFPEVIMFDSRIRRSYLHFGLALMGVNVLISLYLVVYLRWIRKSQAAWEVEAPYAIPIITACGVLAAVLLSIAIWPVWGILSPFFLFVLLMGLVVVLRLLPF
ncbi:hypothetical protein CAOG_08606 [Capsaspora owczarzaki ATCC 30864]|uniref:Uncharacterized protein n=1 Tax=Capsaspora owczarzaki (strain ATCC 30864) TaxID=595528 RepID=A0A0D2WMD4_CAPO3|nr:hypothetical protein CAOG_08606 [Capsaspora owczarzaki ATCC 30864]KJE91298.1 hypothetical protein CAOG_008606 [Capsaspora owczarzaki ATCC 30864]|eukprot:XP_011270206.1 hypothetical protein CAOG_08606 [Capsaspora owczarzaki ATCC 30864]